GWAADSLEEHASTQGLACVRADRGGFGKFQLRDAAEGRNEVTQPAQHPDFGTYWRHQRLVDFGPVDDFAKSPPTLGEHTAAIMKEVGYSANEIANHKERGIVR